MGESQRLSLGRLDDLRALHVIRETRGLPRATSLLTLNPLEVPDSLNRRSWSPSLEPPGALALAPASPARSARGGWTAALEPDARGRTPLSFALRARDEAAALRMIAAVARGCGCSVPCAAIDAACDAEDAAAGAAADSGSVDGAADADDTSGLALASRILGEVCDDDGWTLAQCAAGGGCEAALRALVELLGAEALSEPRARDGHSLAHTAAISGSSGVLRYLLDAGADLGVADANGDSPLHWACFRGRGECVALLVGAALAGRGHVDMAARNIDGGTALHSAANCGDAEAARALFAGGAAHIVDVNAAMFDGSTAVANAAFGGHAAFVRLLLAHGADANAASREGKLPLQLAASQGHVGAVEALLGIGGDDPAAGKGSVASAAGRVGAAAAAAGLGILAQVNGVDRQGDSALHWACAAGARRVVKVLLAAGADSTLRNADGGSALHACTVNNRVATLEAMLKGGADPNLRFELPRERFSAAAGARWARGSLETALHVAAADGRVRAMRVLLSCAATKVDLRSAAGRTPLHDACHQRRVGCAKMLLLRARADFAAVDEEGRTPLGLLVPRARMQALLVGGAEAAPMSPLDDPGIRDAWALSCAGSGADDSPAEAPPAAPLRPGVSQLLVLASSKAALSPHVGAVLVVPLSPLCWPANVAVLSALPGARARAYNAFPPPAAQRVLSVVAEASSAGTVAAIAVAARAAAIGATHAIIASIDIESAARATAEAASIAAIEVVVPPSALMPPTSLMVGSQWAGLGALARQRRFCDLELESPSGFRAPCHRIVLAARSPPLLALLSASSTYSTRAAVGAAGASTLVARVPFEADVLVPLLSFIYSGRLAPQCGLDAAPLSVPLCLALADVADAFDVPGLCCAAQLACADALALGSVMLAAEWAQARGAAAEDLLFACVDFFVRPDTLRAVAAAGAAAAFPEAPGQPRADFRAGGALSPQASALRARAESFGLADSGSARPLARATSTQSQTPRPTVALPAASAGDLDFAGAAKDAFDDPRDDQRTTLTSAMSAADLISRLSGLSSGLPLPSELGPPPPPPLELPRRPSGAARAAGAARGGTNFARTTSRSDMSALSTSVSSNSSTTSPAVVPLPDSDDEGDGDDSRDERNVWGAMPSDFVLTSSSALSGAAGPLQRRSLRRVAAAAVAAAAASAKSDDGCDSERGLHRAHALEPYTELVHFLLSTDFDAVRARQRRACNEDAAAAMSPLRRRAVVPRLPLLPRQ